MEPEKIKKHFCSFSEAIREGAKIRPQGLRCYFRDDKSCAFGAGLEVLFGVDQMYVSFDQCRALYPYLDEPAGPCPACRITQELNTREFMIIHLNDFHAWTREAIADWLESEEEKLGFVTLVEGESLRSQTEVCGYADEIR